METTAGTAKLKSNVRGSLHVAELCLVAILVTACSVDIDKLRAPASTASDAAVDLSDGGDTDARGGDGAVKPSDLRGADVLSGAVGDAAALDVSRDGARGLGGGAGGTGGVTGAGGTGRGGAGSGGATSFLAAGLVAYYPCDQTVGPTLLDLSNKGHSANLGVGIAGSGGYRFTTGKLNNALYLVAANQGYARLPQGVLGGATEMTIATWVYLNASADWQRVWDFGNDTNVYTYLTARASDNQKLRFGITLNGKPNQQVVNGVAELPINAWKHVAVVLGSGGGFLYVDGQLVGSNPGIFLRPDSLGTTLNNYIGRSQYLTDPYFDGGIDDFRVYNRALSAAEIRALYDYAGP